MNHRYAYCKPEDALMHELRQQMKKNNADGNSPNGANKQRKRRTYSYNILKRFF